MTAVTPVIPDSAVPRASRPVFQHILDTYASEINKVICVWRGFSDEDLGYRPHPRSSSVEEIMKHELLSGRRFFGEFLGFSEPPGEHVLPKNPSVEPYATRMHELAVPRLTQMAAFDEAWWLERVKFFDVERERIWIFWRRVLHTAHHRTQLSVYLRLLNKTVPSVYGPSADVTWTGADPTQTVAAAERR